MAASAKAPEYNQALYAKFKANMTIAERARGRIVEEEVRGLRCGGGGSKSIMSIFLGTWKKMTFWSSEMESQS